MNKFRVTLLTTMTLTAITLTTQSQAATYVPAYGEGPGIAIGWNSDSDKAVSSSNSSLALVAGAKATANAAVAIGRATAASGSISVAYGLWASATVSGGVAAGAYSVANRAAGDFGKVYNADGTTTALTSAVAFGNADTSGADWNASQGIFSIGASQGDQSEGVVTRNRNRQLTGLAAGSQDNDAVNVAQLKSLQQSSLFGAGVSNLDSTGTAVQGGAALGDNSQVQVNGGVAIGLNSVASNEGRTAPAYLKTDSTTGGAWQTDENHGLVSFGGSYEATVTADDGSESTQTVTFNRQLTGVAAGSEDNDAVNVAQLKAVNAQVEQANTTLNGLMNGTTQVSQIQLTSDPENENAPTIGLRYQMADAAPVALADGDAVTPTSSQGRLVYNNIDSTGAVIGQETVATLSDGFFLSGGTTTSGGATVDSVKVDLNQGISFLGDEYLETTVTADEDGAKVTISASQTLKDLLNNSGIQPDPDTPSGGNTGGNTGGSTGGNTGGSSWTPTAAQQAALNGTYANGLTAGEGNNAVSIAREKDVDGRYIVDMGGNRVQNVGAPIAATDAANKQYVDSTANSLRSKIHDVDRDLRAGVAMAMAVGNLPQAYMPGKSIVAMSAGTYHGQGGFALGLSHATNDRNWIFKGAASVDTRGNFGGTLSAGYQF